MRRKSEEEKRASNAARQKRWREKHRNAWLMRQRQLAVYGKSKAQLAIMNKEIGEELKYERCDDEGRTDIRATGTEAMEDRERSGRDGGGSEGGEGVGRDKGRASGVEGAGGADAGGGALNMAERRVAFEGLKREYGVKRKGVEVELEV